MLIYFFILCCPYEPLKDASIHHLSNVCNSETTFHVWVIPGNQEAQHTPPSVVIVVVLGDEDVVLLEQRREVLADLSPHIQEGHHYQSNPDKTEGGLLPPRRHRNNRVSSSSSLWMVHLH